MTTDNSRRLYGIGLVLIILAGGLAGWLVPLDTTERMRGLWLAEMFLLFIFAFVAGKGITGVWRGLFIDERNKMSLSRLQMALWTVLLLSAYLTAALFNLRKGQPDPLSVTLHPALWGLMGISTVSLVGSPLIKSTKKEAPASENEEAKTKSLLTGQGVNLNRVEVQGQLLVNKDPQDASWTDLFKGEEVGNAANLDLGKVQMFYFTLIIWFAYASSLAAMLKPDVPRIGAFPDVSPCMLALLAISHAGYLAVKAVPHTAQQPSTTP